MHSIRAKITAIIMTAIVTCVLVLGGIGFFTVGSLSDQISVEKMHLTSENAQRELDGYLSSLRQSVDMVGHIAIDSLDSLTLVELGAVDVSGHKDDRTPEQQEKLDAYITEHCALAQAAFSSVASHTNGIVTYYYCINPEVSTKEHGFFYSRVDLPGYEAQEPIDAALLDPADTAHNQWYHEVMRKRRPCWVGPYTAHFLDERWTVSYVTPIYKSGIIIGVLGMDILFETLAAQIDSLEVYDHGFACLLDDEGRIIYHPEIAEGIIPSYASQNLDLEMFKAESSGDQLIRYDADGEQRQLSFSTLVNGQKLVVVAPVSEITSSLLHLTERIVIAAIAILAAFVVYALFFANAVTAPLIRLTSASQRLASGDYDVELDYSGKDEVGMLTDSFRQMSERLGAHITDLNSRAFTDALTGIKNKAAYNAMVNDLDEAIQRGEELEFAFAIFDCNRLKEINDRHGHARGDSYLKTATKALCTTFEHSPVFRLGGDEFGVLLRGQDLDDRYELMERFDAMAQEACAAAKDPWDRVDLAKGLATYRPGDDEDFEHVARRADHRMYEDKRRSRQSRS